MHLDFVNLSSLKKYILYLILAFGLFSQTDATGEKGKDLDKKGQTFKKATQKKPISKSSKSKKGSSWEVLQISFATKKETITINTDKEKGEWFLQLLPRLRVENEKLMTLQEIKDEYEQQDHEDFELFWDNKPLSTLYKVGLLRL